MAKYYTDEKHAQVILYLLKKHGIRKVIASPGTTNMAIVASMQSDPFFEMYSSVDERSAAYLACGLATESGEPVVISCTGATASRNYLPGLTEAFYRKLPILAITSTPSLSKVGHHEAQVIDRSTIPKDVTKLSVTIPLVRSSDDLWECELKVNQAILELKRHGGGPAHINLTTTFDREFSTQELPVFRVIKRVSKGNEFPKIANGKIAIFIGAHSMMSKELTELIDKFCSINNGAVFCDHTSNYKGFYRVLYALGAGQQFFDRSLNHPDLMIHIGEVSGDYYSKRIFKSKTPIWRVSEDGEIRDTFRGLTHVFEMSEKSFFEHYSKGANSDRESYYQACKKQIDELHERVPDLPFSNIWMASVLAHRMPQGSTIHFGILNSLRSWNFFELPLSISSMSNVGGFGIDGNISSLIGASFANKDKLFFGVVGDLAFFYDMNVIGNRHVGNNLRILLVNNGKGTEFRQYNHVATHFGDEADKFIAAAGHFGRKSEALVKNYSEILGFEYISANDKREFEQVFEKFISPKIQHRPIVLEAFTNSNDESVALERMLNIDKNVKGEAKQFAKKVLGKQGLKTLKRVVGK